MYNDAAIKIVGFLVMFVFIFLVFAVLIAVGVVRQSRTRAVERELYPKLAASSGWSYSPEVFPAVKAVFDHIDGRMFPSIRIFSSPAKHILSGSSGNTNFAVFDYTYSLAARYGRSPNMSASSPRMMYESGVLITTIDLNIPEVTIEQRNEIVRAFNAAMGDPVSEFDNRFSVVGNAAFLAAKLTPPVRSFILNSGVIRVLATRNFVCIFFPRNENDTPDLGRIRAQLEIVFKLGEVLGMSR
jgi:hypothetical protein